MIGNDIIDIAEASKIDWGRKGFLEKIFNEDERNLILNSENPGLMVWLLWSMKESGYKIFLRQSLQRAYNPLKFKCKLNTIKSNSYSGKIYFNNFIYSTKAEISGGSISTIAVYGDGYSLYKILRGNTKCSSADYSIQHKELYDFAAEEIAERINKPISSLSIKKDLYGIPHLYFENSLLNIPISLSHHGYYAAYAITR